VLCQKKENQGGRKKGEEARELVVVITLLSSLLFPDQPRRLPRGHHLLEHRFGVHHVVECQHRRRARLRVVKVEGGPLIVWCAPGEDLPDQSAGVAKGCGRCRVSR
jgi:hypothetical protein